jgi:predicted DNA-binding transcriptional regulator YafY
MNLQRPDPKWRRITPHAFGYDGYRWHARAYCRLEKTFKDFLLPRILKSSSRVGRMNSGHQVRPIASGASISLGIAPHPMLTESQQDVVAKDYGMIGGMCVLQIRYAMLF